MILDFDSIIRKLTKIVLKKTVIVIRAYLTKKVYGVSMLEMIGMRICCYILLTVMIIRVLGD